MNYDLIIVGCGLTGSTIAYLAANRKNLHVLLIEKRSHVGGNLYDETDPDTKIVVQKYGPHSFHTDKKAVYRLMCEVGGWEPYTLRARVRIKGRLTPSPFNFKTIDTYYSADRAKQIKKHLVDEFDYAPKVTILQMLNSTDPVIKEYAQFLFENDYKPYTAKQWGISPEGLDPIVLKRVPVRLSYTDAYFDDRYQMMPEGGFTSFFRKMLKNRLITVQTGEDALDHIRPGAGGTLLFDGEPLQIPVVYTGALDEFFGCCFGQLPYRSLRFKYQTLNMASFQETSGVAYPMADGFTRITEFTKLPYQDGHGNTIVAYEYPEPYGTEQGRIPYYPVLTENSEKAFECYRRKASEYSYLFPCGRLADFRYYNMDDAVERAMEMFDMLLKSKVM
ncbi:MAG: UDP-galactopyranose mutase [Oscillospiraceae bacterium]|nr:UDP-galactopyranose mutase [Oscillospiraceae bacterium]